MHLHSSFSFFYPQKVYIESSRKFNYDIYYDYESSKYKIDSYGVPMSVLLASGPIIRNKIDSYTARKLSSTFNSETVEASQALYSFIFDYQNYVMYSIFPGTCAKTNLRRLLKTPGIGTEFEDILGSSTYVGTTVLKDEPLDQFVKDYVLTQVDYFQTQGLNGTLPEPRKLIVADESFTFYNVNMKKPDPSVFIPPPHCN